jgi:hypothetical protein
VIGETFGLLSNTELDFEVHGNTARLVKARLAA